MMNNPSPGRFRIGKWWRGVLTAFLTTLLMVSCQRTTPDLASGAPVTLKVNGWGSTAIEERLLQQVLHAFEASHPGIQVEFETIADQYMDVIKTRLIGEAAADVFYLDVFEAPFLMTQGVLEPLDAYIPLEFDLADFDPNLLQAFRANQQLYGLPKDYSTLALFYNRQAFAEAGITRPPQTWDELLDDARTLTRDRNNDGQPDQYGLGILPELPRMMTALQAYGGQVLDAQGNATFAEPAALQGLEQIVNPYQQDRTIVQPSDVGANSGTEMFGQGRVAMVIEGNWAIPFLQDTFPKIDFATAEVPRMNDRPGTMVFTVAYVMNAQSRHKREAWELIAYLTGKTGMAQWTSTGFALPTRSSVAQLQKQNEDELRSPLVAGLQYATPWQIGQYPTPIVNAFNNQFISVLLGQQPLAPAMQKAQAEANEQLRVARE